MVCYTELIPTTWQHLLRMNDKRISKLVYKCIPAGRRKVGRLQQGSRSVPKVQKRPQNSRRENSGGKQAPC